VCGVIFDVCGGYKMKLIIEIDNLEELAKIKEILGSEYFDKIQIKDKSKSTLREIFNNYNVELPKDYKFNRDEANER
jgi:hypothetical protein